jgi:hypothetical protein
MVKQSPKQAKKSSKKALMIPSDAQDIASQASVSRLQQTEWLQDVSIEVPVPASFKFDPGQRQLEFSVGMRQAEDNDLIRSELRARAVIHANQTVLVMVEASYVNIASRNEIHEDLPEYLYAQLKPHLLKMFEMTNHVPPLPENLKNAS